MKTHTYYILICFAIILSLIACNKDITITGLDLPPLNAGDKDANAGSWKTLVLVNSAEIALAAPSATNSAAYQQELQEVKTALANLTEEQKQIIKYWSAGGILRWNQIMRELVAKYNLPPVANADNIYPIPDANNPFSYPQFPFANPPYACRAYAYVSVAQHDALVSAYYYKQLYQRKAPYLIDNSINPQVSPSQLSSYPSEDALIASVSFEMLKALFPAEIEYLSQKAEEQKNYKLWAGAAVKSDILAGEGLGKAVAAKILDRARNDGMRNAIGNQQKWDSLNTNLANAGEIPWLSLEFPARPPMLPFFGKVRTWLFDAAMLVSIRSPKPPATNSAEIKAQLAEVKKETESGDREKIRIVHFWADGVGTYTPPGHWNAIAADLFRKAEWSEVRTARNFALLNMTLMDAGVSCWDIKTHYHYPRPSQLDPSIKTLTGVPNFQAYTSGHSTFSGAASTILGYIFPEQKTKLEAMALEASLSRLYGGIHYRMDCEQGLAGGKLIGNFAITKAKSDGAEE